MNTFFWILCSTVLVGLLGLIGIVSIFFRKKSLNKLLFVLIAFSAGALLAGAFFHLLSESLVKLSSTTTFLFLMVGFVMFFVLERFLHWHHCHDGNCEVHPVSYLILIGDGIHNAIDGLVIAASFLVSNPLGLVTTLLIIGHEIPQELGNFGILVYGGFSRAKAIIYSFIAQLTCVIGGILGYFFLNHANWSIYLLPFTAGGFIYISCSDLIPELHKEPDLRKTVLSFMFFIIGLAFIIGLKFAFGE